MIDFLDNFEPYNLSLFEKGVRLSIFKPSQEQYKRLGLDNKTTNEDFLLELCRVGYKNKISNIIDKDLINIYTDRVKEELAIIKDLGFIDYILMVWDICDFCFNNNIPIGPGRGSVSSSLICYLIGITKIDSIKYGTFFTRFLSKSRAKSKIINNIRYIDGSLAPDIDLDICYINRKRVIEYLEKKYPNRTSKILTSSSFSSKILIKDVLKSYEEFSEEDSNYISGLIEKIHGIPQDIGDMLSVDPKKENVEFKHWAKNHLETCRICEKLNGLTRSFGKHASALLICHDDIDNIMPLQLSKNSDNDSDEDGEEQVINGYDMYASQELSLKFDLLGLKNITTIRMVCDMMGIKEDDININDPCIYNFFQTSSDFYGIFQFESDAQGEVAKKIRPSKFKHIVDSLAISRPGASAFIHQYIDYIHNNKYNEVHPLIDPILRETGGVCLFQEILLKMLNVLGMELDDCEGLRKCVTDDTLFISKTRGWISIETLLKTGYENELFLVMGEDGKQQWKKIKQIWKSGKRAVRTVELKNGFSIRTSRYHQLLTDEGWKIRGRLESEDFLICAKEIDYDGEDLISTDFAIAIIGLICEGYFNSNNTATFTAFDSEMMDLFQNSAKKLFGYNLPMTDGKVARLRKSEVEIISKYMGKSLSKDKIIPEIMMGMTKETTRNFLSFALACEGGMNQDGIRTQFEFSSKSYKFIKQIQLLLLRFGIRSNLIKRTVNGYKDYYYRLYINDKNEQIKLKRELTCCWPSSKIKDLNRILEIERDDQFTTDVIPPRIMRKFINQYSYVCKNEGGHIYKHNVSRKKFIELANKSRDKSWIDLALGKHEYAKFDNQDVYRTEIDVFDFEIEDENTPYIIANGIVIHNCIGKKLTTEIPKYKEKIYIICDKNNHPKEIADLVWKIAEDSGGYQFNLAHATAYAMISAQTIYLKVKYTKHFFLANLMMMRYEKSKSLEKISRIQQEMSKMGIKLLPPSLLKSELDFIIDGDNIRFGLSSIKGISDKTIGKLTNFRRDFANKFEVFSAAKESGISLTVMGALIKAGCLDDFLSKSRSYLLLEYQSYNLLRDREIVLVHQLGASHNYDLLKIILFMKDSLDENGKPYIKQSRFETFRRDYDNYKQIYLENSKNEEFSNFLYEKEVLGYSYSSSLKKIFCKNSPEIISIYEIFELDKDERGVMVGFVKEFHKKISKKKKEYLDLIIEDESGEIRCQFHNNRRQEIIKDILDENEGEFPNKGALVFIKFSKGDNIIFGNYLKILDYKVYLRVSEYKKAIKKE